MSKPTMPKRRWSAEEVSQWYEKNGAVTYANQDDANWVVRKPKSLSWTVNWANPKAIGFLAVLTAAVCILTALIIP